MSLSYVQMHYMVYYCVSQWHAKTLARRVLFAFGAHGLCANHDDRQVCQEARAQVIAYLYRDANLLTEIC